MTEESVEEKELKLVEVYRAKLSHPPRCPQLIKCIERDRDPVHAVLWSHPVPCKQGSRCALWFKDPTHRDEFTHPQTCAQGNQCDKVDTAHLDNFLHLPVCVDGLSCSKMKKKEHTSEFRHIKSLCKYGNNCRLFSDDEHLDAYAHPFLPPCPYTPFACGSQFVGDAANLRDQHFESFSHICYDGSFCKKRAESAHCERFLHILRPICPDGASCSHPLDEQHLSAFAHSGHTDIRPPCHHGSVSSRSFPFNTPLGANCHSRRDASHVRQYSHPIGGNRAICELRQLNTKAGVVFEENRDKFLKFFNAISGGRLKPPEDIVDWVRRLRPAHRCKPSIFKVSI